MIVNNSEADSLNIVHGYLVDLKQEYGCQWSVVPVEECRYFVSKKDFTRIGILMQKHQ